MSDDRIVNELLKDPKVAKIVADAQLFDGLRESPAWRRLYDIVQARKKTWMNDMSRRFMGPEKFWPSPQEIAFMQGFYKGADFVLAHPEHAEKNLERAASIAWTLSQAEAEETHGSY